jgi:calcineurin-like phosphoesterase family protein
MSDKWFTADFHLGHKNIIRLHELGCARHLSVCYPVFGNHLSIKPRWINRLAGVDV